MPTSDVLAEFVVLFFKGLYELGDPAVFNKSYFVLHVLIDEVPGGSGGVALHLLIIAGKQLHQERNSLQLVHLKEREVLLISKTHIYTFHSYVSLHV